jgi:hypothetical protein
VAIASRQDPSELHTHTHTHTHTQTQTHYSEAASLSSAQSLSCAAVCSTRVLSGYNHHELSELCRSIRTPGSSLTLLSLPLLSPLLLPSRSHLRPEARSCLCLRNPSLLSPQPHSTALLSPLLHFRLCLCLCLCLGLSAAPRLARVSDEVPGLLRAKRPYCSAAIVYSNKASDSAIHMRPTVCGTELRLGILDSR